MANAAESTHIVRFADFELDLRTAELRTNGHHIVLQEKPFQVLTALLERPGEMISREDLSKRLWPEGTFVDFNLGLNKAVNRLREVLDDSAERPRFIETFPKRGYRFVAPVTEVTHAGAARSQPHDPHDQTALGTRVPPRRWTPGSALVAFTLLILLLPAAGYFGWRRFRPRAESPVAKMMLAVMPFQNFTGDPRQDYFSDGLTEEMITALGGVQPERLGVIARASVMQYKQADKPVAQIGRELGVQYLLEGSVRRDAGRVRISAQLVRINDQTQIWADNYERDMRDILNVQNEVAKAIAGQIQLRLTVPEKARLESARPVNAEAHEAYLMGRFYWNKRTHDSIMTGLSYFQKAVSLDPKDPHGYAGIADSYIAIGGTGWVLPSEVFPKAKEAALKALALDGAMAEAHSALGQVYQEDRDWVATEKECKRALALNPSYPMAHWRYSFFLSKLGRHEEAIAEAKRARELDPLLLFANVVLGQALYHAHRYDESLQVLLKAVEQEPSSYTASLSLAGTYAQKGMFRESIAALERVPRDSSGDVLIRAQLGYAYARLGKTHDAELVLEELKAESRRKYVSAYFVSWICVGLGRHEEALQWLEKASQQGDYNLTWLGVEPVFDPLSPDPRFSALIRRLGLPQ